MASPPASRPVRTLVVLLVGVLALGGGLAAAVVWSDASLKPKLALDLAGGTQIILTPRVEAGQGELSDEDINQAIAIMRQRVNASGISEAEISSQGGQNIVVELPGDPQEQREARELVRQSAQMRFRPVLVEQPSGVELPTDAPTEVPTGGATEAPTDGASLVPAPTQTQDGRAVPNALRQAAAAPTEPAATEPAPTEPAPAPEPTGPSDLAQITPEIQQAYVDLDCTDQANLTGGVEGEPDQPLVACSQDGAAKYVLGPVEVEGTQIDTATAGLRTNSQGVTTNEWVVQLDLDGAGSRAFRETSTRLFGLQPPQNQFAIVLDGLVVSAPAIQSPITNGRAEISGSFTQDSATTLANQLEFGALPITFDVQTEAQISALLGEEQLQRGLLAGLIGLGLVVVYSVIQYRALGLVTVASLGIAGLLTYLTISLLSWYQGYRLSLPGVAGLIVAIGITADSFIVFFERVRDEVREGRSLVAAVENGWRRARRTILASDTVSFLAALVLFLLAVGGVRGFAFTLGLTTVIDLIVVVLFTHPMVAVLARTRFFGGGHRLSGFDAAHLGRTVAYAGRGQVRTQARRGADAPAEADAPTPGRQTIAERKAAERKAAERKAAAERADATSGRPGGTEES